MKCIRCNHPLLTPAVSIPARGGPLLYGPKCAMKAGLLEPKQKLRRSAITHYGPDENQTDLFEDESK